MYRPADLEARSPSPPKSPRHAVLPNPPSPCVVLASNLQQVQDMQRNLLQNILGMDADVAHAGGIAGGTLLKTRQENFSEHSGAPYEVSFTKNDIKDESMMLVGGGGNVSTISGISPSSQFIPPPPLNAPNLQQQQQSGRPSTGSNASTPGSQRPYRRQVLLTSEELDELAEKWVAIEERRCREWDSYQRVKRTGGGALGSYGSGAAGISTFSPSHTVTTGGNGASSPLELFNDTHMGTSSETSTTKSTANEVVVPLPVPYNLQGETDYSYLYDNPNGANHNQVLAAILRAEEKARAETVKQMMNAPGGIPSLNIAPNMYTSSSHLTNNNSNAGTLLTGNESTSSIPGAGTSSSHPFAAATASTSAASPIAVIGMAGNSGANSGAYGYASTGRHETRAFMDIAIGTAQTERITFELYDTECPLAVQNFCKLVSGLAGFDERTGIKLDYSCSNVYCVKKGEEIQMGFLCLNSLAATTADGHNTTTTEQQSSPSQDASALTYVAEERLNLRHTERGLLSMKSFGPNRIGSFFSITLAPAPSLDFKQVIIGHVVEGRSVLDKIEAATLSPRTCAPIVPITIAFCGVLSGCVKPRGLEAARQFYASEEGRHALQRFADAAATEATLIRKNISPTTSPQRRISPAALDETNATQNLPADRRQSPRRRQGSARRHHRRSQSRKRNESEGDSKSNDVSASQAGEESDPNASPLGDNDRMDVTKMTKNSNLQFCYSQNNQRVLTMVPSSQLFAVPSSPFFGSQYASAHSSPN